VYDVTEWFGHLGSNSLGHKNCRSGIVFHFLEFIGCVQFIMKTLMHCFNSSPTSKASTLWTEL